MTTHSLHRMFAKQRARCTDADGAVDLDQLGRLVSAAYDDAERDQRRTDRAMALMADELESANRRLEALVEEVRAQSRLLSSALENIPLGVALYDASERLTVTNARLCEMQGLPAGSLAPGITFGEAMERCTASATSEGPAGEQIEAWRRAVFTARRGYEEEERRGERIVGVVALPMPEGGAILTFEDRTERRAAEARIEHMARHDALTGLANRVQLHRAIQAALARCNRGEGFAVFCLDLDRFKAVNDTLGHPVGDALLRAVTVRMLKVLRDTDLCARLGGDEFAIVQATVGEPAQAETLAERLVEALAAPYEIQGHSIEISASIGIALAPHDSASVEGLMKQADLALYRAKAEGRNTWRFFTPSMDAQMQARRALELDLRRGLAAQEFVLHYQPQVSIGDGSILGFEALVRWQHPQRGLLGPGEFAPLAEDTGLVVPLGEWVLQEACRQAAAWPVAVSVAVNVSAAQFRNPHFVGTVRDALRSTGLPGDRLELEMTETILLQDGSASLATLHRLRVLGVRISVDDLGTGSSSLSYLGRFPFDKIKIDQSVVRDLQRHGDAQAIVRAIAALGGSLCMRTTAQGVETREQLDLLRVEGCTEAQGSLFGRPVPAHEAQALLRIEGPSLLAARAGVGAAAA